MQNFRCVPQIVSGGANRSHFRRIGISFLINGPIDKEYPLIKKNINDQYSPIFLLKTLSEKNHRFSFQLCSGFYLLSFFLCGGKFTPPSCTFTFQSMKPSFSETRSESTEGPS